MKQRLCASGLACALLLCAAVDTRATTYAPVTFDELITRADMIFVGEVTDVRPYPLNTAAGTIIKTRVIFRVMDSLFGSQGALEVLEFLGGEWNGGRMEVAEMPRFAVGDRYVVLYRCWRQDGERVLTTASSPVVGKALETGGGKIEPLVLPHAYSHLAPMAGVA